MIRRLKYEEIDFEKFKNCVDQSVQRKYSATKKFLDVVSGNNWEILVWNDYEAVMPIPFIKKIGIKIVVNPKLCQQLGVYSKQDSLEINDALLKFLKKNYLVWYYAFNEENKFSTLLPSRKNYIIPSNDYLQVKEKYSPKRKRKLRLDDDVKADILIKKDDYVKVENFIFENMRGIGSFKEKKDFAYILYSLFEQKNLFFLTCFYKGEIISVIALHEDEKSIALLGTYNDFKFIKLNASSLLIDIALEQNIGVKDFDFEGSDLPNIEEFFKGFRPKLRKYHVIRNSKMNIAKNMISKYLKINFS